MQYVLGAVFLITALFWSATKPHLGFDFVMSLERLAGNFTVWFVMVGALWIYTAVATVLTLIKQNNQMIALRNDVQSIATVLERIVLPRRLTPNQKQIISRFLKQFDSHEVSFEIISGDEEAGVFTGDLREGGWTLSKKDPIRYVHNVSAGLSVHFTMTPIHAQQVSDARNPGPDKLLGFALGVAGVRLNGMGSGTGLNVTEDELVMRIGKRRMDWNELMQS
jgi:hypothetical protein